MTLVVPAAWPDSGSEVHLSEEPFDVVEVPVRRAGDVNRHRYVDEDLRELVRRLDPDVVDLHMEPFSSACHQWLTAAGARPLVAYTAQNVDKRFPPPFARYERQALERLQGLYPCSRQAASVARGKGFHGLVEVLPLGVPTGPAMGSQRADDDEVALALVGRLVPEKGVSDAVRVLERLRAHRRTRLVIAGAGPEEALARTLVAHLGLSGSVEFRPWQSAAQLEALYRETHVVLVPSSATQTWVEQFGRTIVEGQAAGAVVAGYASGSIPEVAGPAGILVPEHDVDGLAAAVLAALADVQDFSERRSRGLAAAGERTWAEVARRQVSFYESAAAAPRLARQRGGRRRERLSAIQEFGPTATLAGPSVRPFALPVLRRDVGWTRLLARALDLLAP
ncbi:MAG: glycosyltransferase [Pseudorhodobacter sp.]|nr:glycosyltransferase [Frankiaceae bacterium]